jgi:hypothetical protein
MGTALERIARVSTARESVERRLRGALRGKRCEGKPWRRSLVVGRWSWAGALGGNAELCSHSCLSTEPCHGLLQRRRAAAGVPFCERLDCNGQSFSPHAPGGSRARQWWRILAVQRAHQSAVEVEHWLRLLALRLAGQQRTHTPSGPRLADWTAPHRFPFFFPRLLPPPRRTAPSPSPPHLLARSPVPRC